VVLVAVSGVASAERLPIRTYSAADGLPHDEINKIIRVHAPLAGVIASRRSVTRV
jgi:hypothetical protein